jgi:hypothetical protein
VGAEKVVSKLAGNFSISLVPHRSSDDQVDKFLYINAEEPA